MTTSPRLGFSELTSGQATPETSVNEMGRYVEQGANVFIVKDLLTTPPGSPSDGDAYLVIATATGAWASKEDKIAFRMSTGWLYITPFEGLQVYDQDEDILYVYVNAWITVNAPAATIWAGASKRRFISPYDLFIASAPSALTSSASITPDGNNGFNFSLTLAHSGSLNNPSNFKTGQSGLIVITQDGTGSRTLSYGSQWKFPGGAPVLSTSAGAVDVLSYYVFSTGSLILATLTKAYSS